MPPPQHIDERVVPAARSLKKFAAGIRQTHRLGYGPGLIDEPWSAEFQQQALAIYTECLPLPYLAAVATESREISRLMTMAGPPADIGQDWLIVTEFLRTISDTVLTACPNIEVAASTLVVAVPPVVLRFDLLARLTSAEGTRRLRQASESVTQATNPLTQEEIDLILRLASGDQTPQLTAALNYSPRTLQRKLSPIKQKLGVGTRTEIVNTAKDRGLLPPDR